MNILFINSVCGIRSTGKICAELADKLTLEGHECKIAYGREAFVPEKYQKYAVRISTDLDVRLHALASRIFDSHGLHSKRATKKFIRWAESYNPDLVWLHNIHGYYINYELLFRWIKSRPDMQVKWTLHDCWVFTGHCSHFTYVKCEKWKTHCDQCPQKHVYPKGVLLDRSKTNFERKKRAFTQVQNMKLITPSKWLASLVKESFLKDYPVEVIYNTIDKTVFKPTPSDFRKRYGIEDKFMILGVASVWDARKGLDDFLKLSALIDEQKVIVLVGLSKQQITGLPPNIIGIERTNNVKELAEIYTAADVFVNPSKEETFGLTTVEAISCGTRAIVYKDTACEEIAKEWGGIVVRQNIDDLYNTIINKTEKEKCK
ncbi:MAG TPA: glycosyltransferase [Clostridiales bacterium]|nr:glycosyltransferase [Clostridiales bacterium]